MRVLFLTSTAPTVAAAMLLLSGCGHNSNDAPKAAQPPPPTVQLVKPHRGDILRSISLPANVWAWQQATLFSKVTGYLKTLSVDKGDEVKQGDLLADIEVPELLADIAKSKASAAVAEVDYKRVSEAQKKAPDLVMPQSVDEARARLDVAKASLSHDEILLGFTKITAPFAGVVTRRFVDPGAFIPAATAGSSAQNAALITLADFSTVRVTVAVPEPEVPFVKKDTPSQISIQELGGKTFTGTVTRIAFGLDESTRTMLAEVDLPNPQRELRPGMYAIIKLGVERHVNSVLLPADAVLTEKAGKSVFVVDAGKARKRSIKAGFDDGAFIEILDGVAADQSVIQLGKQTLQDGQPVNALEAK